MKTRPRKGAWCRADGLTTVAHDINGIPRGALKCQPQLGRSKRERRGRNIPESSDQPPRGS